METNEKKERYSDAELEEFKALILEKIAKAERDLEIIRGTYLNHAGNGTEDTSPTFKPFEEGSETMSKEANARPVRRSLSATCAMRWCVSKTRPTGYAV